MGRTKRKTIGTITQLPSGSYRVRWYAVDARDERKRRAATFATRAEAEAHLGSLRRDGREDPASGTLGRVFTSGLIDGERRFIEWRREGEEKLRAERKPERLPAVLLAAEQVGQSLAAYGSARAVGGTQ